MKLRLALVGLLASFAPAAHADPDPALVARGEYLVTIIDCGGCHTPGALRGERDPRRLLAGSEVGFGGSAPMGAMTGGVVYPANLTPDRETGLGSWSDQAIVDALRHGRRPDGRILIPVMPWPSYARLTDEDAQAIAAYLRSIPPVRNRVPANVPPGEPPESPYLKVVGDR